MSRYIDADVLYNSVKYNVGAYWSEGEEVKEECLNEIDNAPTADVVEVRHGQWSVTFIEKSDKVFRTGAPHCSLCGRQAHHRTPFCPNCGAKMDGERKGYGT